MTRRWTEQDIPDLTGKVALVTGANAGLGLSITIALAEHGARVLMACRNLDKAENAAETVRSTNPKGSVEVRRLDLADLASVDALAAEVGSSESQLDLLINNAGLMALDESRTEDGFETQFGVNHLGHFALTAGLMPVVLATPGSRIVTMSSMGHRMGRMHFDDLMMSKRYSRWPAYFQSKLSNLLFTAELHRRLTEAGASTMALAAHPGATNTDLGVEGSGLSNKVMKLAPYFTQSATAGALPLVRAATDPSATGGQFYGPNLKVQGRPVLEKPSRRARRADDAARLWTMSEELTKHSMVLAS